MSANMQPKLKYFLLSAMILYGLGGLMFLIDPTKSPPGEGLSAAGILLARSHGADLIGWAVAFWLVRNEENSVALRALLLGNLCYVAIESPVLIAGAAAGTMASAPLIGEVAVLLASAYFALRALHVARGRAS